MRGVEAGVEGVLPGLRKAENPLIVARALNAVAGASQSSKSRAWACVKGSADFLCPFYNGATCKEKTKVR